jgi:NAD(P)-dependent dehydrogenase (short-subunit alcohol dehydrogenase family)
LVTGATAGIGEATAAGLAALGATVVVAGRDVERCSASVERIKQQTRNPEIAYLVADLSSQREVRRLAEEFKSRYARLDALVNSAGAINLARRSTVDGIELTFALNHLSYFLLTDLLIDLMISSAPARIVNVSSSSHRRAGINFDNLQGHGRYRGFRAYAQSKLGNVLFTYELARRLDGTGVTANALHPGVVATRFLANNGKIGPIFSFLFGLRGISPAEGARTSIYLASSSEVEGITGGYYEKSQAVRSAAASYDEDTAARLWDISAEMTAG